MAIQSDETLVTKGDLKTLYTNKILPYLGGNMMMQTGVSDYYSTDEKIIGLFTDGKPIYQKTFTYSSATVNSTPQFYIVANISSYNIDKIINCFGNMQWGVDGPYYSLPFTLSTDYVISVDAYLESSEPNLILRTYRTNGTTTISDITITLQYTKTTDTASSALITPGCYDLNRPDLWPENKEIFFGNGLYGYRKTGNFTASSPKQRWETDVISLNPETGRIVSTGGSFTVRDASSRLARCTLNSTVVGATTSNDVAIFIESYFYSRSFTGIVVFQVMPDNDFSLTANDTYDVWLTYTK